jgi:hypothetical protein
LTLSAISKINHLCTIRTAGGKNEGTAFVNGEPAIFVEKGSHHWLSARALVLNTGSKTFGYPRQAPYLTAGEIKGKNLMITTPPLTFSRTGQTIAATLTFDRVE